MVQEELASICWSNGWSVDDTEEDGQVIPG